MNTKLLASIAAFALLTSIVVVSVTDSAYAAEAKKDEIKAKKDAKKEEIKAKKETKKDEIKAKKDAKKEEIKAKKETKKEAVKEKVESKKETKPASGNVIEIAKGSATPGCETTSSCYLPNSATVKKGTKVTWKNADSAAHTVTSGKDATPDGTFDSGMVMAGKSFSYTFNTADTYNYYCAVHPWMTGTVTAN